jgi:hypothetical protein
LKAAERIAVAHSRPQHDKTRSMADDIEAELKAAGKELDKDEEIERTSGAKRTSPTRRRCTDHTQASAMSSA